MAIESAKLRAIRSIQSTLSFLKKMNEIMNPGRKSTNIEPKMILKLSRVEREVNAARFITRISSASKITRERFSCFLLSFIVLYW